MFARARRLPAGLRRSCTFALAFLMALVGTGAWTGVAAADPEGGTTSLRAELDDATRGYLEAQHALEASKARQVQLATNLEVAEANFAAGQDKLGQIAASAYRTSGFTNIAIVISDGRPEEYLGRVTLLNALAAHEHAVVTDLINARNEVTNSKAALEAEIAAQTEQLAAMNRRKQQAEQALWAHGGCISPRTAHARDQAIAAGFTYYNACWRSYNDGGEHPKGRACDFAVHPTGFGGDAYDEARTYGNSLAAFFFFNANRLGVLYIIWYRQIWLPSSGWRSYSGCCDPSSMHTNHVHLSMY